MFNIITKLVIEYFFEKYINASVGYNLSYVILFFFFQLLTYRFMFTDQVKIQILLYYNETVIVKTCLHKIVRLSVHDKTFHLFLLEKNSLKIVLKLSMYN